jgi:hypothetical protein
VLLAGSVVCTNAHVPPGAYSKPGGGAQRLFVGFAGGALASVGHTVDKSSVVHAPLSIISRCPGYVAPHPVNKFHRSFCETRAVRPFGDVTTLSFGSVLASDELLLDGIGGIIAVRSAMRAPEATLLPKELHECLRSSRAPVTLSAADRWVTDLALEGSIQYRD